MNKFNLLRTATFLFLYSVQLGYAQEIKNAKYSPIYFDHDALHMGFEDQTKIFIANNNYLTREEATVQLEESKGKVVTINRVKPYSQKLNPGEIYQLLQKSTVAMGISFDCGKCDRAHVNFSSGYIISEDGLCVTNYHVVESFIKGNSNLSMQIMFPNGKAYPVVGIVAGSESSDLAILKVDAMGDKLIPIPFGEPAMVGDDVFVLSNPYRMLFNFTKGMVTRNYLMNSFATRGEGTPEMEISADYAVGSSGAPIVDVMGNLVSTVSTTKSIYVDPAQQKDLQMVVKGTKPIVLLEELVRFK